MIHTNIKGGTVLQPIAYIATDIQFTRLSTRDHELGLVFLDLYDLPYVNLSAYAGLIITNFVEEEFLFTHKAHIEQYLSNGGVIFSQVENTLPWLPGCGRWIASSIPIKDRYFHIVQPLHQMFKHIDPYDLNYKKGVKGFLSRGYFDTVPNGALILIEDQDELPVLYIDRHSTKGTIFAGAGTDLYRYGISENSTCVLSIQMLETIRKEHSRLQTGGIL